MDPKTKFDIAILSGTTGVWFIFGCAWLFYNAKNPAAKTESSQTLMPRYSMRILGVIMLSIIVITLVVVLASFSAEVQSDDWLMALILSAFLGGWAGISGFLFWKGRIYISKQGIRGWSKAGFPRFIEWDTIKGIEFSGGMHSYKLTGDFKAIYVPAFIANSDLFLELIQYHTSKVKIQENLQKNLNTRSDDFFNESYFQSLEKHAKKAIVFSGVIVFGSFYFFPPPPYNVLFISALGGACLFAHILFRNMVKHTFIRVQNTIQFIGFAGSIFLTNIALSKYENYLGGRDTIDGYTGVLILLQALGLTVFFGFLFLETSNRLFKNKKSL